MFLVYKSFHIMLKIILAINNDNNPIYSKPFNGHGKSIDKEIIFIEYESIIRNIVRLITISVIFQIILRII